ncbi:MAG: hypothetical protein C0P77_003945 [Thermoanaerobacterales bacterium]|nr:hypothetical protein [Thermoanaerobacterales bacterium]
MRRSLPLAATLAAILAGLAPHPSAADPAARPPSRPAVPHRTGQPPGPTDIATELDLTVVVPALQDAFGDRYGGYWIEDRRHDDVLHVAVVDATEADRATVAGLTGHHPRVVTDAVTHGYDDLLAAQDEIALSLDPDEGDFTVEVDVAANAVVVRTEAADVSATTSEAREAARRGARRQNRERGRAPRVGTPWGTPGPRDPRVPPTTTPPPPPPGEEPASDLAEAVEVVPEVDIDIAPQADRNTFPPYAAGLSTRILVGTRWNGCTTGYVWANAFGYFGSTAGHCGRVNDGVVIGPAIVDVIRANGYQPHVWVQADAALISLSARGWPHRPEIRAGVGGRSHRTVTGKYLNAQIGNGLELCFQGVTSDSGNCGRVVRANQWICCDAAGKSFYYSCIDHPSLPGDSGGPVYRPVEPARAVAAGMVSSSVTINGTRLTCFSTVESIEYILNSRLVTG